MIEPAAIIIIAESDTAPSTYAAVSSGERCNRASGSRRRRRRAKVRSGNTPAIH